MEKVILKSIGRFADYNEECVTCGKQLKTVMYTNAGPMGRVCFQRACGYPVPKRGKKIIITPEISEDLAAEMIRLIESADPVKLAQYIIPECRAELKFPLRFINYMRVRYRPMNGDGWVDEWYMFKLDLIANFFDMSYSVDMMNGIKASKTFNEWFSNQQTKANRLGVFAENLPALFV